MDNDLVKILVSNWREEKETAFLYSKVAGFQKDGKRKKVLFRLSEIEQEHASLWAKELRENLPLKFKPRFKVLVLVAIIRCFGEFLLLEILERVERAKVRFYFNQLESGHELLKDKVKTFVSIEKSHSSILNCLKGEKITVFDGCNWHKKGGGIRDIIFGMNDGLLSTFSLIAGVAGSEVSSKIILLAGVTGTIAGAISMAAGAFVSTRAEKEVMEAQLEIESKEIHLMPEDEHKELSQLYQQKGMPLEDSEKIASIIMSNHDVALDTMAREELGFSPDGMVNPLQAAFFSGFSFVLGALIPLVPIAVLSGRRSIIFAAVSSFSGFFLIGAGRTIVTEKNPWKSGFEMFMIGSVAAVVTYFIGNGLGHILSICF